jgi:hypothetical protein
MSENTDSIVQLGDVRLSFPVLFEAKAFDDKGKKEFSATFLIPKTGPQAEQIKSAITAVANGKWGAKGPEILKQLFRDDKLCMHDGDKKDYDGYAGNFYVRATNATRPLVINRDRSQLSAEDGVVYSGCYVNAILSLWAQDNKFGKRINANLRGVQFFRAGEAFSGGGTASVEEFAEVAGEATTVGGAGADIFG